MTTIVTLTSGENGADSLIDINANYAALNSGKQENLVSGTNIKTINGSSILGSGDLTVSGTGDVVGPASSTDNAITRFDSTTGKLIQNSTVTVADDGVIANVNAIQLDTTPSTITATQGQMYWDTTENTVSVNLDVTNGVTLSLGTEQYVRVVNKTGSQINDGQVVYISGAQGNRPTASLALADALATSNLIGVATQNIANNAEGFVTTSGEVHGYNTTGFTAGDKLYVSASTAGLITNTAPASPNNVVVVGVALNSTVNGTILVKTHQSLAASSTLADNSDLVAPTQKAVKTYADTKKTDSMSTGKLLGRSTAGTGVIEEITLGSNLSFSGTTLNATSGSGGISRTITSISTPTNAGSTASVDYVYLVSGTTTLTLPTAVGNTNRYTVKNVSGTTTIATTSAQTIDGSSTASLPVQYTSLDLVSDGSNWLVI